MFTKMIAIEQQKISRRTMFWVELALFLLVIVGAMGLMLGARSMLQSGVTNSGNVRIEGIDLAQTEAFLSWPLSFAYLQATLMAVGPYLIIVLAGTVTAQEYGWRSFQLWLSRGVGRLIVLPAKMTAVTMATFLLVGAAFLLAIILSALTSLWLLDSLPFDLVNWGYVLISLFSITLALLPYGAIALLLAVLSRSTAVTIGVGLALVTFIEPLGGQLLQVVSERWAEIATYLPGALGESLVMNISNRIADGTAAFDGSIPPETAALGLILYTGVFLALSVALFQRQDLGG